MEKSNLEIGNKVIGNIIEQTPFPRYLSAHLSFYSHAPRCLCARKERKNVASCPNTTVLLVLLLATWWLVVGIKW